MKARVLNPNAGSEAPANKLTVPLPIPPFSNKRRSPEPVLETSPAGSPGAPSASAAEVGAPAIGQQPAASLAREGDVIKIPVDLIDPNPFAPREIYTPEMILQRADNLRTQGQHDPIHVIPNPDEPGRYIIADGWTRTLACKTHAVFPTLNAIIHYGLTAKDAAWFGFESNEGREQHCDFDRAMFFEKMIAEGMSQSEVARRVHMEKSAMSMYLSFSKLPDEILLLVREYPSKFTYRAAYAVWRIFEKAGIRKAVAVAGKFCEENQPIRWLENQVQAAMQPSTHKSTSAQKYIRYTNGFYKQRSDEFELSIKVPADKRAEFAAALESLLSTVAESEPQKDTGAPIVSANDSSSQTAPGSSSDT